MSVEWADDRIDNFRNRLHPSDVGPFDRRLKKEISNLDISEISDDLRSKFRRSEAHLDLVRAAASGFHQSPLADGYSSGYEFAFTEPLSEQNSEIVGDEGVANGDVLLVKEDGSQLYLCVIECKAGASGGRDWVNELSEIEEILEADRYREILMSQLDASEMEIRHIQYVLLGLTTQIFAMDYDSIADSMDIPENYAFWGYSPGEQSMVHIHGNVRDDSLMGVISDSIDTGKVTNPIEFTYGDHPLTQIQTIIEEIITSNLREGDPYPFEFNRFDFRRTFEAELQVGYGDELKEEMVTWRVEYLLEMALAAEIIVDSPSRINSNRDFRIYFRGQTAAAAKESAKSKYFDWKSKEKLKDEALEEMKHEFETLPPQADLGQFMPDSEVDDDSDSGE